MKERKIKMGFFSQQLRERKKIRHRKQSIHTNGGKETRKGSTTKKKKHYLFLLRINI